MQNQPRVRCFHHQHPTGQASCTGNEPKWQSRQRGYNELLQPWLEYPDVREAHNWMDIFQRQLNSWVSSVYDKMPNLDTAPGNRTHTEPPHVPDAENIP